MLNASQIIHRMLGGDQFMQATGTEKIIVTPRAVTYRLPVNNSSATHCNISISDARLYTMQFFVYASKVTLTTDTYPDQSLSQLPSIFKQVTGLRL